MSIIILILKIIGMVLISLLAFVIILGILLLLVPARYQVKGSFCSEKKAFSIRITWLLRAVSFLIYSGESGIEKKITIFGFRLKEKKKDKTNSKEDKRGVAIAGAKREIAVTEKSKEGMEQSEVPHKEAQADSRRLSADKKPSDRKGFFQKIADKINGIIQKIKGIYSKICETIKKAQNFSSKIKEFLVDAQNKVVFGKLKNEVLYLLKHFKPRKIEGKLLFGTGDPATTGWVLGGIYALYQGFPGRIDITPDFDEKVIDGEVMIKGRIRSVHAILVVIRLFGNKDFRRMLQFRKNFVKKTNI